MRGRSPSPRSPLFVALLAILLATTAGSAWLGLKPAQAQLVVATPTVDAANVTLISQGAVRTGQGAVQTTKAVKDSAWTVFKTALTNTAAIAILNGANYFAQKVAYDAAVYIASGGNGQKPFFTTEGLGNYLQNTAEDAAGEVVGTLASDPNLFAKYGINLCAPKDPTLALNFKLGFLNGLPGILGKSGPQAPKPKCTWDSISSNWDKFANQPSSTVLNQVGIMFSPGESSLGAAVQLNNVALGQIAEKKANNATDYASNQGFKPVKDFIAGDVKTPAATVQNELHTSMNQGWKQGDQTVAITGSAFGNGAFAILPAMLQTFAGTLSQRLLSKVFTQGLITVNTLLGNHFDKTLTFDAAPQANRASAELANASLLTPKILSITNYDALTDFATCPSGNRGPDNCVMDTQFYNAVTRADQDQALTVAQAVDQGLLSRGWLLLPLTHRKNQDPSCYSSAFCYTNLVKLRLARVLPIGWELAANSPFNDVNHPVSLGEAIDRFEDCPRDASGNVDATKLPDPLHPWCHLIDPQWVLKYPSSICRQQAPGPTLVSPDAPARSSVCVDPASCIAQDASGNCIGGYGYCVREKSVWKLDADSCPAQYASCTTFNRVDGKVFSFLSNTLDAGACNAQNAGCRQYSVTPNAVPNPGFEDVLNGQPRDWMLSAGALLHVSGTLSSHGMNAVGVFVGQGASASVPSLQAGQHYVFSAAALQELEGTNAVGTARLTFLKADGSTVDASNITTTCQSDASGKSIFLSISATGLGYLTDSCQFTTPPGTTNARLDLSSNAPAAGNHTWFDDLGIFGASFSTSPYDGVFLNAQTEKCASTDAGCTDFVRLSSGTLNAVRNPSFEDADAVTKGPEFWTMDVSDYESNSLKGADGSSEIVLSPTPATQDVSRLLSSAAYSFSVATRYDGAATPPSAQALLQLYDASATPQPISPVTVDGCTLSGTAMQLPLAVGTDYQRATCSFTTPSNVGFLRIILTSGSSTERVLADAVQLELAVHSTDYHDGYAGSAEHVTLKRAPDGLDCSGATPPSECANYAPSCRREEVGCNAYTPVDGGTTITGVVTDRDACPAECAGYDTFKQEETAFNAARFPLFLIPTTAESCTASQAGCTEFTNIEKLAQGGESREYFTRLRLCTKPDTQSGTFYTWEGSDVSGYQLRSWSLRKSNIAASPIGPSDPTGGTAPCTKLAYDASGQPLCADDAVSVAASSCIKSDIAYNPDCREFYDVDGNIHYRHYSATILSSDQCTEYRITKSTETECRDHGGRWQNGECRYLAYAPESLTCPASANACRAYSGNASRNVRILFTDGFEDSKTDGWTAQAGGGSTSDVVNSTEAVTAGEHSLKVARADVTKGVSSDIHKGKSYLLTFWAKGSGDLTARLSQAADQSFTFNRTTSVDAPIALTTEWKPYQIGPVIAVRDAALDEQLIFQRLGGGTVLFFLDNIELREVTDDVFLIEDSWKTPASCDQSPTGAAAPQYMLGCRAYTDRAGVTGTFTAFDQLCRAQAVGCEALYNTRNSASPFPQTFRAVCSLASSCVPSSGLTCPCSVGGAEVCQVTRGATTCRYDKNDAVAASHVSPTGDTARVPADDVEYLVNDPKFRCDPAAIGCTEMGNKTMNNERTSVQSWDTAYLRNLPATYGQTLCLSTEQYCQAYTRNADSAPFYFKDPELRVCAFRDGSVGGRGWFKKGTDEPCDPNFLESGDRYGIWKNSDAAYAGWVGECPSQDDMCKEFIDPVATSPDQPKGQPYYAIMNDRLDTKTCQGRVSLDQSPSGANAASACVLFWQTDNLTKTYSATATYALSDAQHGALVPAQPGGDSNIILRVQRDRECSQWLDCRSSETVFNASSGTYQNVCTAYSLCAQFEKIGDTTRCVRYADSAYAGKTLTVDTYESRTVGSKGSEFSGFSIPNEYPVDELVTVNVANSVAAPDLRLVYVSNTCATAYGSACGPASNQGTCLGPAGSRLCAYPIDGGHRITQEQQLNQPDIFNGYPGATCRAYPQEDAPFPSSVADPSGWNNDAQELNNGNPVLISPSQAFRGANVCQRSLVNGVEVSSCECNYQIADYGSEKKYFPAGGSNIPTGYCTGGTYSGYECDPLASGERTKENLSCCSKASPASSFSSTGCEDDGQCVRLTKVDRVVGYEGQCLERDTTEPLNGGTDQFACLAWRPVGLVGGTRDIYNQNQSAGYFAAADRRFYCVGPQDPWALHLDINSTQDYNTTDNHDGITVGPYDQYTDNYFGPGVVANGNTNPKMLDSYNCQDLDQSPGGGGWCAWPADFQSQSTPQQTDGNGNPIGCSQNSDCDSSTTNPQSYCNLKDGTCHAVASSNTYRLDTTALGVLGCYAMADDSHLESDANYIEYPYIGPPIYSQQLLGIYFQVSKGVQNNAYINPTNPQNAINSDCGSDQKDTGDSSMVNEDNAGSSDTAPEPADDAWADRIAKNNNDNNFFFLTEKSGWKVDPSNGNGQIVLSASFDQNGLLKSIRVAAAVGDGNDNGTFGLNRMGFIFKPGCSEVAQIDQPGEFGATQAFTNSINSYRNFDPSLQLTDVYSANDDTQLRVFNDACRPYSSIGSVSAQPPTKPWTYVAARQSGDYGQCTVLDFLKGAAYQTDTPEDLAANPPANVQPFHWAESSLRVIFRKIFAIFQYQPLDIFGHGGTYQPAANTYDETDNVDPTALGFRSGLGAVIGGTTWNPPRVASVDLSACNATGQCKVASLDTLTVNGHTKGLILGADGALSVTGKFFAWASHDSMPIVQRTVLWGDLASEEPPAKGWYKNEKPYCSPDTSDANAIGQCDISGLTCLTSADCFGGTCNKALNLFGNTPGACNAGTFQFDHIYTCTLADLQSMPACTGPSDLADNAPCYRVLAGTSTCVYRPKVQIVDNWGWCNCTGSGCKVAGGAYKDGCSLSNPPANAKPWTEFTGEVRLTPTLDDARAFAPPSGGGAGSLLRSSILHNILISSESF